MQTQITNPDTRSVYAYLRLCIEDRNCPPTIREIADVCHMSRTTVIRHLEILGAWGLIVREPHMARGITLVKDEER